MMPSSSSHTTKIDDDTISTLFIPKRDANAVEVGKQGVQLKHFERVVKKLLTTTADTRNDNDDPHGQQTPRPLITINYTNLPLPPTPEWPFDQLPSEARVYGTQRGQLPNIVRAQRKEDQLRCMLACVMALLENCGILSSYTSQSSPTTIVDFGGGSGHLAIPLALLLPHCRIVVVDLSERALDLLHEKAQHIPRAHHSQQTANEEPHSLKDPLISHSQIKTCSTIPNLYTFHGPVEAYNDELPVDLGIALHLCGQATDVALRKCAAANARAMVMCPCCVGKLNPTRQNPYVWQATGQNQATVQYPQSSPFAQILTQESTDWNALAKAADYSDADTCRSTRNATRRCAKALLETDRRLFLEQTYGYQTALTRMEPWEATPKNDILLAWKTKRSDKDLREIWGPNHACLEDIATTKAMLLDNRTQADHVATSKDQNKQQESDSIAPNTSAKKMKLHTEQSRDKGEEGPTTVRGSDANDWTADEVLAIEQDIQRFLDQTSKKTEEAVLVFPTGMGRRRRRLIHFVAAQCNLAHWSIQYQEEEESGKTKNKSGCKTVAVARRRVALRRRHEENPNVHLVPSSKEAHEE